MPSNFLHAAFIRSVDRKRREIRVEVPPYTDGASLMPLAEVMYPVGDDSTNTEIRLVEGAPVYVAFEAGDPRYPIIMGFRNPNIGNVVGMRRWNHDNFELNADETFTINAGTAINLIVGGTSIKLTGAEIASIAAAHKVQGPVTQTGGDMTSDGISAQHHKHPTAALGPPSEPQ